MGSAIIREVTIGDVRTLRGESVSFDGFPKEVVLYGIFHGEKCVYVGSTNQTVHQRVRAHICDAKQNSGIPLHIWMVENKFNFTVKFLDRVSEVNRHREESKWVSRFGYNNLLNLTDGGAGLSGHTFKRRIKKRLAGFYYDCMSCSQEFYRKPRDIKKGHIKFCSRDCYQEYCRINGKSLIPAQRKSDRKTPKAAS